MRNALYILIFATSYISTNVLEHLDANISHNKAQINGIGAAFLIRLFENKDVSHLVNNCKKNDLFINEYDQYHSMSLDLMTRFCSPNVSPYILTQVLSHLSIYKYCLDNGIDAVLILEDQAKELNNSEYFFKEVIPKFKKRWDIIYLDADYHDKETGEYVYPKLAAFTSHKKKVSKSFSKVYARYGTVSYLISKSGMLKLLKHYSSVLNILPLDQEILNVKRLNKFATNFDVFTNEYSTDGEKLDNFQPDSKTKISRREGELFSIHPNKLLSFDRFDILPKYIFAKYFLNDYKTNWHVNLYKSYLKKWLNFSNYKPYKLEYDDFYNSFVFLINDIKANGYNCMYPIKVSDENKPSNGAHRIGTCLALDIPVEAIAIKNSKHEIFSADVFKNEFAFEEKYLDHMAYEYTKLSEDSYIACLFPIAQEYRDDAIKILNKHGSIIYSKDIYLSKSGMLEFIRLVYNGEWWTGSYRDDYKHSRGKVLLTFPSPGYSDIPVTVFLFKSNRLLNANKAKSEVRNLCKLGNDVIHINDTHEQTSLIASTIFNKNSLDFINNRSIKRQENFDNLMSRMKDKLKTFKINPESLCLSYSSSMSAFGKSDIEKMIVIHRDQLPNGFFDREIISFEDCCIVEDFEVDDTLFNPEKHFFYNGLKFVNKNE